MWCRTTALLLVSTLTLAACADVASEDSGESGAAATGPEDDQGEMPEQDAVAIQAFSSTPESDRTEFPLDFTAREKLLGYWGRVAVGTITASRFEYDGHHYVAVDAPIRAKVFQRVTNFEAAFNWPWARLTVVYEIGSPDERCVLAYKGHLRRADGEGEGEWGVWITPAIARSVNLCSL